MDDAAILADGDDVETDKAAVKIAAQKAGRSPGDPALFGEADALECVDGPGPHADLDKDHDVVVFADEIELIAADLDVVADDDEPEPAEMRGRAGLAGVASLLSPGSRAGHRLWLAGRQVAGGERGLDGREGTSMQRAGTMLGEGL